MEKAAQQMENELGCCKLLTVDESRRVGSLMERAQSIEIKLNDEVASALSIDDYLATIQSQIKKINREQVKQHSVLDQCESNLPLRQSDVDQALKSCEVNINIRYSNYK